MHLCLSGTPRVQIESTAPPLALGMRDAAILVWLAIEGPTSRVRLAELLWPLSAWTQARTALRQRLFQLKRQVGAEVVVGAQLLRLAESVTHDLADANGLLGDLRLSDAPEFDAWLQARRALLHEREREQLRAHAQALEDNDELDAALQAARALLRCEPVSEASHQRLMRLHYRLGDRAAALAAFDACEQALKHELGTRPGGDTLALLDLIETSGVPVPDRRRLVQPVALLRPPRMVGRDRELEALQRVWGQAHVAAVVGEAGMGKSRLLAEFSALQPGIVRAAGRPSDHGIPFATLARLLRDLASTRPVQSLDPVDRHQLARVLPEMDACALGFAEGQRLQLQRALARYIQSSPGLVGLVLDDLHFADLASLEMLAALIADAPAQGPRWALAYRPAEAGSAVMALQTALADSAQIQAIELTPLDEAALAELVDSLNIGVDGGAIARQMRQRTGGNPLYVLETLKQACVEDGLQDLSGRAALPRALSVERLIDRRIQQLSPAALALARVASIAGVDFSIALAESMLEANALQFADALLELENAQVLRGTQFAHDLVFDAVLRSVPAAIAQHLHGRAARWLENHDGEPARIARHWIAAQHPASALPWLQQAAQRARAALRNAELLDFLDLRADIEESLGKRREAFDTRREATKLFAETSRDAKGCEARLAALERLAATDAQRIRAQLERAAICGRRTEPGEAEALARSALESARQIGDAALVRECQLVLFDILILADRTDDALPLGEACMGWVDGLDEEARLNFHGAMAVLYSNVGQPRDCIAQTDLARQIVLRQGDAADLSALTGNLAVTVGETGQLCRAIELGQESLRLSATLEARHAGDGVGCLNLVEPCTLLGKYRDALRWADEAERLLAGSAPAGVPLARLHRSLCYWHLGQHARAIQGVREVAGDRRALLPALVRLQLMHCRMSRDRGDPTRTHIEAGLAAIQGGARPHLRELLVIERALTLPAREGIEELKRAAQSAERAGYFGHALEAHLRCAQVGLPVEPREARRHAERALELFQDYDTIASYRGEVWLHCARALLATGDVARGRELLGVAMDWVQGVARDAVPDEFRESFLFRNPVNASLSRLAEAEKADTVGAWR